MPLSYSGLCSATLPRRTGSTIFKQLSSSNKQLAIQRRSRHTPTQQHITTQPLSHHEHRCQTPSPQMGRPQCVRSVLDAVANSMYNSIPNLSFRKQLALECRRQATSGKPNASNQPRTHRIRCFMWHCIYLVALYECVAVCDCLWLFVAVCDCLLLCVVVCGCSCLLWCGCAGVRVLLRLAACLFEFEGAFQVF